MAAIGITERIKGRMEKEWRMIQNQQTWLAALYFRLVYEPGLYGAGGIDKEEDLGEMCYAIGSLQESVQGLLGAAREARGLKIVPGMSRRWVDENGKSDPGDDTVPQVSPGILAAEEELEENLEQAYPLYADAKHELGNLRKEAQEILKTKGQTGPSGLRRRLDAARSKIAVSDKHS